MNSIRTKLAIGTVAVAVLFLVEFFGIFAASRQFLTGMSRIHHDQELANSTTEVLQVVESLDALLQKPSSGKSASKVEQTVFFAAFGKSTQILGNLRASIGDRAHLQRIATDASSSLNGIARVAHQFFTDRGTSEKKAQRLIIRQLESEATESLRKLRIEIGRRSDSEFDAVYDRRYQPIYAAVSLTLAFMAIALVGGFAFSKRLNACISNLTETARKVALGDLRARAEIKSRDELGVLAHAFNEMTSTLQSSTVSRQYLATIIDSMPDLLVVTDPVGGIRSQNAAAKHLIGTQEARGVSLSEFVQPAELARILETMKLESSVKNRELELHLPAGEILPVSFSASRLPGESGGLVCVFKDITERKKNEQQLQERNDALAAANRELEAFSYSVSHDLRAPLRSIDGFSKALVDRSGSQLDAKAKEFLHRIRESAQRMAQLIDDLLNLSRISRAELNRKTVNLSEVAREVFTRLNEREPRRNVEAVIQPDVMCFADRNLMQIVLENLISNSWKFTSKHASARIEFGASETPRGYAYWIRDDGAGFDMEFAGKLFQPFQRLHGFDEFPGTGIGLALVKRIIQRHGGETWAEGAVERGASVYFTVGHEEAS